MTRDIRIGVIGLGYVGLPLAVAFSKYFNVVGYDTDSTRIAELSEGIDRTNEVEPAFGEINQSTILFSDEVDSLHAANFYCVCVPTPLGSAVSKTAVNKMPPVASHQKIVPRVGFINTYSPFGVGNTDTRDEITASMSRSIVSILSASC